MTSEINRMARALHHAHDRRVQARQPMFTPRRWEDLDPQHVALVCPRSGLAARGITVANSPGIIDAGYTGTIQVIVKNQGRSSFRVAPGDRIAQLLIMPHLGAQYFGEGTAERGAQGFGSNGTD